MVKYFTWSIYRKILNLWNLISFISKIIICLMKKWTRKMIISSHIFGSFLSTTNVFVFPLKFSSRSFNSSQKNFNRQYSCQMIVFCPQCEVNYVRIQSWNSSSCDVKINEVKKEHEITKKKSPGLATDRCRLQFSSECKEITMHHFFWDTL